MLAILPTTTDTEPALILQSPPEYDVASEVVKDVDPELAHKLSGIALTVKHEGRRADSTAIIGARATEIVMVLHEVAGRSDMLGLRAQAALEGINYMHSDQLDNEPDAWPEDLVSHLQNLPDGPHSMPVGRRSAPDDPDSTRGFKADALFKNDAIDKKRAKSEAEFGPKLLQEQQRIPRIIE